MFTLPILGGGARRTIVSLAHSAYLCAQHGRTGAFTNPRSAGWPPMWATGDRRQVKSKRDTERRVGATQL